LIQKILQTSWRSEYRV